MTVVYCTLQRKFYQGKGFGRIAHANGIIEGLLLNKKYVEVWGDKGLITHDFNGFDPKRVVLNENYFLKTIQIYQLLKNLPKNSIVIIRKDLFSLALVPFLRFFIKNIIVVKEVNGLFFDYTRLNRSKLLRFTSEIIHKITLKSSSLVYCVDEIIAERLTTGPFNISNRKIAVINNGGPSYILNTPTKSKIQEIRLLYFGLLSEYSELDLVISASQKLNMCLDIVGEGPTLNKLQSLVRSLSYNKIYFHGYQSMDYVKNLIRTNQENNGISYIGMCPYCLGSDNKKFAPIKGFVYLSFNLPVIFSSLSYQGVFTDGIHGKKYSQGKLKELTKSIGIVEKNYLTYQSLVRQHYPQLTWKSRMDELLTKASNR